MRFGGEGWLDNQGPDIYSVFHFKGHYLCKLDCPCLSISHNSANVFLKFFFFQKVSKSLKLLVVSAENSKFSLLT